MPATRPTLLARLESAGWKGVPLDRFGTQSERAKGLVAALAQELIEASLAKEAENVLYLANRFPDIATVQDFLVEQAGLYGAEGLSRQVRQRMLKPVAVGVVAAATAELVQNHNLVEDGHSSLFLPAHAPPTYSLDDAVAELISGGSGTVSAPQRRALQAKFGADLLERAIATGLERGLLRRQRTGKRDKLIRTLPPQDLANAMLAIAETQGPKGTRAAQWRSLRSQCGEDAVQAALDELTRDGRLVRRGEGRAAAWFTPGHAPPDERASFERDVLEKVTAQTAWLEDALVGSGAPAAWRREVLAKLVRAGHLDRLNIAINRQTIKIGFVRSAGGASDTSPKAVEVDRPRLLAVARELERQRFDHTVTFEELASRLNLPVDRVHREILSLVEEKQVRLVQGEPREVRHPETARIVRNGLNFYRFTFL